MTRLQEVINLPGYYWLHEPISQIDALVDTLWSYGRVAVLDAPACLVNNLRVWENLILPAWYHHGGRLCDWEAPLAAQLTSCGLDEAESQRLLVSLPAMLTLDERRWLILLRAAVLHPEYLAVDVDWLFWLQRQDDTHPARRLWQSVSCVCIAVGQRSPGDDYLPIVL